MIKDSSARYWNEARAYTRSQILRRVLYAGFAGFFAGMPAVLTVLYHSCR